MQIKWVMRADPMMPIFRICRVMWNKGIVGDGNGYSAKLTVGIRPKIFQWNKGSYEWALTLLCVRIHHRRSYGGRFV